MRTMAKAGLVAGGYAAALGVAALVAAAYAALTAGPDRQNYPGMFAFGDSLLFLVVFCAAALPATGLWLYYLRAVAWFWSALSALAVGASAVSVCLVACALVHAPALALMVAPLWFMLAGPVMVCGFGVASLFAPTVRGRRVLAWAAAIPCAVVGVVWVRFVLLRA